MLDSPLLLVGRSSSHFTRVTTMFASELGLPWTLQPVHRLLDRDPASFGGHPALKIPTLLLRGAPLYGAENICRKLSELAGRAGDPLLVFPERLHDDSARNAQELVWVAMGAQVQLRLGQTDSPSEHLLKVRAGLQGALSWLEGQLDEVLLTLPSPRQLSLLELTLFCLVDHLRFLPPFPLDTYPRLLRFAEAYGERESARRTPFRFDTRSPQEAR